MFKTTPNTQAKLVVPSSVTYLTRFKTIYPNYLLKKAQGCLLLIGQLEQAALLPSKFKHYYFNTIKGISMSRFTLK